MPGGAKPGDLEWAPCTFKTKAGSYAADCGTLIVPEVRAKPDARLIALPVMRIRASSATPAEPVFYLGGGPGQSNMGFDPPAWLLANHDVVLVGYRGADGSSVLKCPEIARALKGVDGDLLSPASLANLSRAMAQAAGHLQAEGVDLAGYTIPEVIEDLEAVRAGLGYARVNLLSGSYGTRVALLYAYLHPERVHRSAMVGVNPPGRFVWEPGTVDAQLAYYARLWAADAGRRAGAPDLAESVRRVAHGMPHRWLFLPIDPGKVKVVTFALLFHRATAAQVLDAYLAADRGDASGLALISLAANLLLPSMFIWGDLLAKGVSADYDPTRDYAIDLNPPGSILGSPIALLIWGPACQGGAWPAHRIPAELRQTQPCQVETLLISGSVDFSTPAEFARDELLPSLSRGRQVILAEMGHIGDVFSLQPAAFERLLTSFYATGVADDSLYTYLPMDFGVKWVFPVLAKLMLGGAGVLALVALGLLLWLVVG